MSLFRFRRGNRSLGETVRAVLGEIRAIVSLEIELRKVRVIQAARNAALVAVAFLAVATLLFLAGLAALVAVGLALAIVMPGWAAALVVAGMLAGLAAAGSAAAVVVKPSIRRRSASRERPPSRSPAEVEADLADAHYRLDAEIDGLTRRADGNGARTAVTSGRSAGRSWRRAGHS